MHQEDQIAIYPTSEYENPTIHLYTRYAAIETEKRLYPSDPHQNTPLA